MTDVVDPSSSAEQNVTQEESAGSNVFNSGMDNLEVDVQAGPAILTTTNYGMNSPGSAIPICCYRSRHVMLCGRSSSLGKLPVIYLLSHS